MKLLTVLLPLFFSTLAWSADLNIECRFDENATDQSGLILNIELSSLTAVNDRIQTGIAKIVRTQTVSSSKTENSETASEVLFTNIACMIDRQGHTLSCHREEVIQRGNQSSTISTGKFVLSNQSFNFVRWKEGDSTQREIPISVTVPTNYRVFLENRKFRRRSGEIIPILINKTTSGKGCKFSF